jgi:DNA-binding MarR family transcriptional regulator
VAFDPFDPGTRDAVVVGLAWRDLRRARWLGAFGDALLDGESTLEASEVDTLDQIAWTELGRMHEIAEGLQIEASTATRAVDRLERRGLVERRSDPDNRRFTRVVLTDEGRRVQANLLERRLAFTMQVLDHFGPDDRAALVRLLPELVDVVTGTLAGAARAGAVPTPSSEEKNR